MTVRTDRLYQRDSFLTRFRATVLDARSDHAAAPAASARLAVILDQTAFYPTGGGQPHDTGRLAGLPVVDVRDSDDGPLHIVEMRDAHGRPHSAHLTVGETIEGAVDWERRFDHMQQHSGQHILSRAFIELAAAATRSFHLGEGACTIDVEIPQPGEEVIRGAEARANGIIWSDRAVQVRELPVEEPAGAASHDAAFPGLGLKPGDPVRIIEIEGFDATPCGGTHVARSGQVGIVGVIGWERFKGMCRVTFVCGGRAAARLKEASEAMAGCVTRLSARPREVPNAIDRLLLDREELNRRVRALEGEAAGYEAERMSAAAPLAGPYRLLRKVFRSEERSVEAAQTLARRFVEQPGRLALIAVTEGDAATLLTARSEEPGPVSAASTLPRMGDVIAEVCRGIGGRGGGAATHARAGGIPGARVEEALDAVLARLLAGAPSGRP